MSQGECSPTWCKREAGGGRRSIVISRRIFTGLLWMQETKRSLTARGREMWEMHRDAQANRSEMKVGWFRACCEEGATAFYLLPLSIFRCLKPLTLKSAREGVTSEDSIELSGMYGRCRYQDVFTKMWNDVEVNRNNIRLEMGISSPLEIMINGRKRKKPES